VLKSTFAGELSIDLSHCVVDEITLIGSRCGNYQAGLQALTSGLIHFESADQGLKAIHLYCGFGILIQVQNGFAF